MSEKPDNWIKRNYKDIQTTLKSNQIAKGTKRVNQSTLQDPIGVTAQLA